MELVVGCTTRPFAKLSYREACERIASAGYTDVALFINEGEIPVRSDSTAEEVAEVRQTIEGTGLRPSMLLGRTRLDLGLEAALQWMADKVITEDWLDVDVELDMHGHELPREAQLTLFRIAQEALVNTKRHAEASRVVVRLEADDEKVQMTISDNGKGFEVPKPLSELSSTEKLGLIGMQERAQLLRGALNILSERGKGTVIVAEIPLHQ